jgi:CheY-like chemotaxis protein
MDAPRPDDRGLVWLVDDDHDCLEIGRRALESAGYRVACFGSPAEALACSGERPVAIVTDLMMGGLDDGFTFAKRVRQSPALAGVPILVTTAIEQRLGLDVSPRTAADLEAMHIDAFVSKPVSAAGLREALAKLTTAASPRSGDSPGRDGTGA